MIFGFIKKKLFPLEISKDGKTLLDVRDWNIKSIKIPNSVTSIRHSAFWGCKDLNSVHISDLAVWCNISFECDDDNPLYYAHHLFINDDEITDLIIPNRVTSIGKYAFYQCTGLTSVTVPNSVTHIGDSAFSGCKGLTSVTVPNSVTHIGDSAFKGCTDLTSVTIPNSVTRIGNSAFDGCTGLSSVSIPNSVTHIGNSAFSGCKGLTSVTIPNSVTHIGWFAFSGCIGLTSVTIPNSVTHIGDSAFSGCKGLTSVTIPNSVTKLGWEAFRFCTGLTSVTINSNEILSKTSLSLISIFSTQVKKYIIGDKVTNIGDKAFSDCDSLISIKVDDNNPVFDSRNDCNAIIETSSNTLIVGCKSTVVPDSVTSIGDRAFTGCTGLTSITIPAKVTRIGNSAFEGCIRLLETIIPFSVEIIGERAFDGCPIKEVILPKSTQFSEDSFDTMTRVKKAKVFISYSWDNEEHMKWVERMATDLEKQGIHVTYDKRTLHLGDGLKKFMYEGITQAENVICIMTPEYKRKAEEGIGGIGEEYPFIKEEIGDGKGYKYIPVLRKGTKKESLTEEFIDSAYLDFRNEDNYDEKLEELFKTIIQ